MSDDEDTWQTREDFDVPIRASAAATSTAVSYKPSTKGAAADEDWDGILIRCS